LRGFKTEKIAILHIFRIPKAEKPLKTDRELLMKGVKRMFYTLALMFTAPVVLYQAFKNQDHPWYLPVLILGVVLAVAAVGMGFYGIRTLVNALFSNRK
jgi:DMSO reductase anchor subunit